MLYNLSHFLFFVLVFGLYPLSLFFFELYSLSLNYIIHVIGNWYDVVTEKKKNKGTTTLLKIPTRLDLFSPRLLSLGLRAGPRLDFSFQIATATVEPK